VTLNDLEQRNGPYVSLYNRIRQISRLTTSKWLNMTYCLRQKRSPNNIVLYRYISFMAKFAEDTENKCIIERLLCNVDPLRHSLWRPKCG